METILYLTAGDTPTGPEQADIDKLNALAAPAYDIRCANSKKVIAAETVAADYVAGTLVAPYNVTENFPEFDLDAPPKHPGTLSTQVVLTHGDTLTLAAAAGTVSVTIAAGVATYTLD